MYRTLLNFFPDNLDYGLRLAEAPVEAGQRSAHEPTRFEDGAVCDNWAACPLGLTGCSPLALEV